VQPLKLVLVKKDVDKIRACTQFERTHSEYTNMNIQRGRRYQKLNNKKRDHAASRKLKKFLKSFVKSIIFAILIKNESFNFQRTTQETEFIEGNLPMFKGPKQCQI